MQGGFTNVNPVAFLQRFSANLLNNRWILLNHIPLGHISFFLLLWPIISWDGSNQEIKFVLYGSTIAKPEIEVCGTNLSAKSITLDVAILFCTWDLRIINALLILPACIQHAIWRSGTSCLVTWGVQRESTGPNYDYNRQHTVCRDSFLWFNEHSYRLVVIFPLLPGPPFSCFVRELRHRLPPSFVVLPLLLLVLVVLFL